MNYLLQYSYSRAFVLFVFCISTLGAFSQDLILEMQDNRVSDYDDYIKFVTKKNYLSRNYVDPDLFERYNEIQLARGEYYKFLVKNDFFSWHTPTFFYVESIFKKIIASNPQIKSESVRLLLSRSSVPNAYSIGDGTIVINIGLIDFLNNEDQIAFVLCHELAHYIKDHSMQKVIRILEKDINKNSENKKKRSEGTQLKEMTKSGVYDERRHQRIFEFEADAVGLELYRNTSFALIEVPSTLLQLNLIDSLLFKISPERLIEILKIDISKNRKTFSSDFHNEELDWNEDSLRTHPACVLRSERLREKLTGVDFSNEIVNDEDVKKIKMTVQEEMIECMMFFEQFDIALLKLVDNLELNHNVGYSISALSYTLYNLADYRRIHKLNYAIEKDEKDLQDVHIKLIEVLKVSRLDEMSSHFSDVILGYYNQGYNTERVLYSLAMLNKFSGNEELYLKFRKEIEESHPNSKYKIL